jgi:putative ABC transport system ATP-binding protein
MILDLQQVSKTYFLGDVAVPVLHDVNLQIPEGELTVVVGPSGSGKSTLLNLIGGIDSPTAGSIYFRDQLISHYNERQLTEYRRHSVGFVFQFYNLIPTLTALENVVVATNVSRQPMEPEQALELVGLSHRLDHFPAQLSGGEQQRVAIARAVAKNPDLLLCDEPTGALDLKTGRHILAALMRLNRELRKTVLIITHNLAIAGIGDRMVRIGSGTIAETTLNRQPVMAEEVVW